MNPVLRKGLVFALQFVPLFAVSLFVYSAALRWYEPLVLRTASAISSSLPAPTRIETSPGGGWQVHVTTEGRTKPLAPTGKIVPHLVLLSLALLPALLLATPAPPATRLKLLGGGIFLLFLVHTGSVLALMRGKQCLLAAPGNFLCLWLLRLVYASGQVCAAALWALLTWRYWFPREGGPLNASPSGE